MRLRIALTFVALLAVAATSGCEECCVIINGHPPPNSPPRASDVELPDLTIAAGRSFTVSGAESLFLDEDPLTLTASSSDTMVVAASMTLADYTHTLTLDALSPGTAVVAIVATEPMGSGNQPQDEYQPSGRSFTRTVNVTVTPGT